ncbi:MAG: hypothetical protein RR922_02490 [Clostridia bacterium]
MSVPKVIRNFIVAVFMICTAAIIAVQTLYGTYAKQFEYNILVNILYIAFALGSVFAYVYIRKMLRKYDLSKLKLRLIEFGFMLALIVLTRVIFGILFINPNCKIDEIVSVHKDLIGIFPIISLMQTLVKSINNIIEIPMLSTYIINTIFFVGSVFAFKKILKIIISSPVISGIGTILFIIYPKFMYYSLVINTDIIAQFFLLMVTLLIISIIKEVKIANNKSKAYLVFSISIGAFLAALMYINTNILIWIIFLLLLDIYISETDYAGIKFSKKTMRKANVAKKAKLIRIQKIKAKKILVSVVVIIISVFVFKLVFNLGLGSITNKKYFGFNPLSQSTLFGVVNEQTAREEIVNSNFKESLDKSTGKLNIGNTVNNIITLNKKGKLKEASKLSSRLTKSVLKKQKINEKVSNFAEKNMDIVKTDVNTKRPIYKKFNNQKILMSLMKINNVLYKFIFVIIILSEIVHIVVKRKRDEYSVTIRSIFIISLIGLILFASYTCTNIDITTFAILIAVINLAGIYYNRDDKVKLLVASKRKF